jgi:2-amino-4-hydroxy-6-hydroxymethyldihydropteridine diphosphokinase
MVSQIDKRKNSVVLSLGGNIGDVKDVFEVAISHLKKRVGELVSSSSLYSTKAWGIENQPDFLNQVIVIDSELSPTKVLECCLTIELELGRVRKEKWHKRVIDIDVLFYNNELIKSKDLIVPHPYIQDRNFILAPLAELIPQFVHPLLQKTMQELKNSCIDNLAVVKI